MVKNSRTPSSEEQPESVPRKSARLSAELAQKDVDVARLRKKVAPKRTAAKEPEEEPAAKRACKEQKKVTKKTTSKATKAETLKTVVARHEADDMEVSDGDDVKGDEDGEASQESQGRACVLPP